VVIYLYQESKLVAIKGLKPRVAILLVTSGLNKYQDSILLILFNGGALKASLGKIKFSSPFNYLYLDKI